MEAPMEAQLDCIACSMQHALRSIRLMTDDEDVREDLLRQVTAHMSQTDWHTNPLSLADGIYTLLSGLTGIENPYAELKFQSNEEILRLYPELQNMVRTSQDPLLTACKLAVAGNIIDFGVHGHYDIHDTIQRILDTDFAVNEYERCKTLLANAESLVLFADNAGELVFDKLLIETIFAQYDLRTMTVVVKGSPIINDATMEDVEQVGLNQLPHVQLLTVDGTPNGNGRPMWLHPEAERLIDEHDVAIAKGQANYEMMSHFRGLFCLLIAKCDIVAKRTGSYKGAPIFHYRP
jgi:uncharacterized protein with ATP-grasp and redox domains